MSDFNRGDDSDESIPLPQQPAWMKPIPENPPESRRGTGAPTAFPDLPRPPAWMTEPPKPTTGSPAASSGAMATPAKPAAPAPSNAPVSGPPGIGSPVVGSRPIVAPGTPTSEPPRVDSKHIAREVEEEQPVDLALEEGLLDEETPEALIDVTAEDEDRLPTIDPAIGYIVVIVITILGLYSLPNEVRFTIVWAALAILGASSIVADKWPVSRPSLRDLLVGATYGGLIGLPMMILAAPILQRLSFDVFGRGNDAGVFQALAFAMPMAETLFFRGAIQGSRTLLVAVGASSLWSIMLLLPAMNISAYPLVALVIAASLIFVNFLYSYVTERVGLFSGWVCQIVINVLLLWVPRLFA